LQLLSVLGTERFLNVVRLIWLDSISTLEKVISSLVLIHDSLGTEEAMKSYFLERSIRISWPFKSSHTLRITRLIQAGIPSDFGLSIDEYSKLLALKSLDQSDKQALGFITAYLNTRNLRLTSTTGVRTQRTSDILKYLVVEHEVPWWVDYTKISTQTLQDHINEFSLKLLSEDPSKWIHDFAQSGHALDIFDQLVQHMNNQQFDRILIAINPNFGSFLVSFNILMSRVSAPFSEYKWRMFVLEYVLKVKGINSADFVKHAFAALSKNASINAEHLRLELRRVATAAIESGEIRFTPIIDMIGHPIEDILTILEFDVEPNETRSFEGVMVHYLKFGAIQVGIYPKFYTYIDFSQELHRTFLQNEAHIRTVIREVLKDRLVRARIVRFESDHFIALLISILFPLTKRTLDKERKSIHHFISDLIGFTNAKVIHDLFYATLFEQSLSAHSETFRTSELLVTFLKKAEDQFQLKSIEKEVSIEIYEMNPTLKEFIIQTFFKSKSKLKLRNRERETDSSVSADTLDDWKKSKMARADSESNKIKDQQGKKSPQVDELEKKENDLDVETFKTKTKDLLTAAEMNEKNRDDHSSEVEKEEKKEKEIAGMPDETDLTDEKSQMDRELEEVPHVELDFEVNLKNAGLVIVWPYLERYFEILEMVSDKKFKSKKAARRAVQLLQYLVTGLDSAPEHELLLNKVLCGVEIATPIPFEIELSDQERNISEQMLKGLLQNWPRLKNTSIEALREGFLVRDGRLIETDDVWQLKVEDKTLDILMDGMPWSFGIIKLPWMSKRLNVEWR
jgi:hypothetical protein